MTQLVSALLLVLLALREALWSFGERPEIPALVEVTTFVVIGVGLSIGLRLAEKSGRRLIGLLALGITLYGGLIRAPELYFDVESAFLQSRRSALLSRIDYGLPWLGALVLFVLFVLSVGFHELLGAGPSASPFGARGQSALRAILPALFFLFGLLALFGYGSGSPWPFLT